MGRLTPMASPGRLPNPAPHPVANRQATTRRAAMAQSRTLEVGMDGHTASLAVASVAQEPGAAVLSLGTIGTRQGESDTRLRQLQAQWTPLVFVSAAGPCGSWLSRSLTKKDSPCWVLAPSLLPQQAGDRVTTDRRDAVQ